MTNKKIIIIGAGPCGLGAAWRLKEMGINSFHIYEKESHVGGLASSYKDQNGFIWDVGGHVLHSHYEYFDQMFESVMKKDYFTHERESWIWIYDRFVPYPFQNNIHRLPKRVRDECLAGLKKLIGSKPKKLNNFSDWIIASFGSGIAKHFLIPYNTKVWAIHPEKMNYSWVGDRVASVDLNRIEENIKESRDDISWGPNAVFHFPRRGGTGAIWDKVANEFSKHISLNSNVERIDSHKKTVYFDDGRSDSYDVLLSTMPLDILERSTSGLRLPKMNPLRFSRVSIVGIGIKGTPPSHLRTKCWMYYPQDDAPFFRATVFSNYSKYNAPKGTWSLMTETSSSIERPLPNGDIAEHVLDGARNTKLISSHAKIESIWKYQTDHGYPTPTIGRDKYLDSVLPRFEELSIYSRGRFGAWRYEVSNQDHTFMQGVEWVNRIILGEPETTVYDPRSVNKR